MIVISHFKDSLDMCSLFRIVPLRSRGHTEIKARTRRLTFILATGVRNLMYAYWSVLFVFPIITAFDRTSLELLGDPASQSMFYVPTKWVCLHGNDTNTLFPDKSPEVSVRSIHRALSSDVTP